MYRTFQSLPMRNRIQPQNRTRLRFRLIVTTTFVLVLIASALMLVFQFGDSEESRAGVAANETMTTGSFIINMGVTPQTTGNGLKPYGMIFDLIRNYSVPVKWIIDPAKTKDANDFSHNAVNYKGGPFVIQKEFITPAVAARIAYWQTQGVVGAYTVSAISVPVAHTLTALPTVMIDSLSGNQSILAAYYANAGIPASAYTVGSPAQLTGCIDVWTNPHGDPTWNTHNYLYDFVTTQKSWIWAQCHSVSMMEYCKSSVAPIRQLNFLSSGGLQCYNNNKCGTNPEVHSGNSTSPYTYYYPTDPVMQFMGNMHGASSAGSEKWYVPLSTGQWNTATRRGVVTSNGASPREGVLLVYGPAYGNSSNGWVMYEAGHDLSTGGSSATDRVAAQRAYFNFVLLAGTAKKISINATVTATLPSGASGTASATVSSGTPPYSYQWTSQLGGTFANSSAATTAYTAPTVGGNTTDVVTLRVTDACGRVSLYTQFINITFSPLPVSLVSFEAKRNGQQVLTSWVTASEVNNDFFTIERSTDGSVFQALNRVAGRGTTSETSTYRWTDPQPPAGICYYRLRQTDYDGRSETFPSVMVEATRSGSRDISIYPNPVRDRFMLPVTVESDCQATLRIYNATGACVQQRLLNLQRGSNTVNGTTADLPAGNYVLMLESEGLLTKSRFSLIR